MEGGTIPRVGDFETDDGYNRESESTREGLLVARGHARSHARGHVPSP